MNHELYLVLSRWAHKHNIDTAHVDWMDIQSISKFLDEVWSTAYIEGWDEGFDAAHDNKM